MISLQKFIRNCSGACSLVTAHLKEYFSATPPRKPAPSHLVMCFPLPTDNVGISYTALSIYKSLLGHGYSVSFITPVIRRNAFGFGIIQCVPLILRWLPWKYLEPVARYFYHRTILSLANQVAVFDLWSDHSPELLSALRKSRAIIVKEKFNCAQSVAKTILASEYARCGLPDISPITAASIASENIQLSLADYIFSPSPMVRDSLIQVGIHPSKIIDTSFGWSDTRNGERRPALICQYAKPRFLYVGSVEIRKGAHLLLKYWKEAAIDGTLIFMGAIREEMLLIIKELGLPSNVVFLGHQEKAHGIYDEADVFVFPSLEEGGPLVTYEALARGLPVIVSPMGAGAIARHEREGLIISPHDGPGWISALKMMADKSARALISKYNRHRASEFTWDEVAKQRYTDLMRALPVRETQAADSRSVCRSWWGSSLRRA